MNETIDQIDDESNEPSRFSEREGFIVRCLNAAANLYGVLTLDEFIEVYSHYARSHEAPISDPITPAEVRCVADKVFELQDELKRHGDDAEFGGFDRLDYETTSFDIWLDTKSGVELVKYDEIVEPPDAPSEMAAYEKREAKTARKLIKARKPDKLKILDDENDFFAYEDSMCCEDTPEALAFAEFIANEYGLDEEKAEYDVMLMQANLRLQGDEIEIGLEYIRDWCEWRPFNRDGLDKLVRAISPVIGATRYWKYGGHTQREAYEMGLLPRLEVSRILNVFDLDDFDEDGDVSDDGSDAQGLNLDELPPAGYTGPVDFGFVKDVEKRERKLMEYDIVRDVTRDFVRSEVIRELKQSEREDAASRLGIDLSSEDVRVASALDMVIGDFASMMDDQHGEPAIRRVLKRKGELKDAIMRKAAEYYENYRYTWLEVLAAKAGVGVKCRDLLTGEELFLMEKSYSRGDVRGTTICAGIAPMGDVYMLLGVIHPANFEDPATILKIVLSHLGIPSELPIRLSFADQARFAAETIRRIYANGKFAHIIYG